MTPDEADGFPVAIRVAWTLTEIDLMHPEMTHRDRHTMTQDAEWLEWRRQGIGGSDIAAAHSGNYGGSYAVVGSKLGLLPPVEVTPQMERGHRWEQPIADAVLSLTGYHVVGEQTWCEHQTEPRHRCTTDGFLACTAEATFDDLVAGAEIKTHGREVKPDIGAYEAQCQWLMHVTGLDRVLLAIARIDDGDDTLMSLRLIWIERDEALIFELTTLAGELLAHVDAGTMPEPTASAIDAVRIVNAESDGSTADLSVMADDIARWVEAEQDLATLTEWVDTTKARVRHAMGMATTGRAGNGWQVTISKPSKILTAEAEAEILSSHPELGVMVLDKNRAKLEVPDLVESLREAKGARVMRQPTREKKQK
jgi:predicted phage-related endonuclease